MNDPFKINNVLVRTIPVFDRQGNSHQIRRVTMYIGNHGPFTADFGPGSDHADTPEAVETWKRTQVQRVMQEAAP